MITPIHKEQLAGTAATLSCKVSGLTKQLDEVKWTSSTGTPIAPGEDGYRVDVGTFSGESQTSTLIIRGDVNVADSSYNCLVTSREWGVEDKPTKVISEVYSKLGGDTHYCV